MSSLFLSYRRADCPGTVKDVFDRLKIRLPRWTLFYDHKNLSPGEDFPDRLRSEVISAKVVLVVMGPRWIPLLKERRNRPEIDHVREEVRLALQAGNKVIPVLVENASMPRDVDLSEFSDLSPLLRLNGRLVRPDPDFDNDLERLAAFLDEVGPGTGPGTVFGAKYKVLREIGQGGMGVVYEAEQLQPHRRVAIKMILEGMDTKEVLARFDGEKEALARMDHPNIARVIDSGSSPSGKPYFVMEYVKGEPITAYCDRKRLPPNDRLKLFRLVCSAVQHAHLKGIVHRDIKPSNVLVEEIDNEPVPKVIDFGLAKALAGRLTDKTLVSEAGKTVGTLIYSSPEQAAGRAYDIDTRTDVYSLGVLMYELLAGQPPFSEDELRQIGDDAMRREIIDKEPSKPSTKLSSSNALPSIAANRQLDPAKLTRLVRGELDWIAMRALEKDPKRRYETPSQFSDDIERYLNHEPVKAGRPSALYRLSKFVRRNRGPVLTGCLVFAAIIAGLIAVNAEQHKTAIALTQRKTALDEAEAERTKAIESAALAAQRFDEKRDSLNEMLKTFSDDQLRGQPGSQPIRKLFLERGLVQYQAMLADRVGDPAVSLRAADTLRELAVVAKEIGQTREGLAHLDRAVQLCRQSSAANPNDPQLQAALGDALFEKAQGLFEQQNYTEAKPFADESIAVFQALSAKFPQEIAYEAKWGRGLVRRASLLPWGPSPQADLAKALPLLRKAADADSHNPDYLLFLARAINNDAKDHITDRAERAEPYKKAVELTNQAIRLSPAIPLGNALRTVFVKNVSLELRETGKSQEALGYLDGLLPAIRLNMAENPAVVDGPVFLSELLIERAIVLESLNRKDEAIATYQEVIQTNEGLAQRDLTNDRYPLKCLRSTREISRIHQTNKRKLEAIQVLDAYCNRSDSIMSLRPSSDDLLRELIRVNQARGALLLEQERYEQARAAYNVAIDLYDKYQGGLKDKSEYTINQYLFCCDGSVRIDQTLKNTVLAIELLQNRILPIDPNSLKDPDHQQLLLSCLLKLSTLYAESGQHDKALKLRLDAVKRARDLLKGDPSANFYLHDLVITSHEKLADLYQKLGDDRGTFEAMRKYFSETEPYVSETDNSALLAETREFTPEHLAKLREAFDKALGRRALKKFTVPVEFDGVNQGVDVYVADSWKYFEDQVKWIEKVRNGKFPQEVKDSFLRLYKIAKEHKVSFQELCVYSLGGLPSNSDSVRLFEKVAKQKKIVADRPHDPGLRLQLAEDVLALATSMEKGQDPPRALLFLDDVKTELDRCLADGAKDDARVSTIRAGMRFVRGKIWLSQNKFDAAYKEFLEALRSAPSAEGPALKTREIYAELGDASKAQHHHFEAATWYIKAAEAGLPSGLDSLENLIKGDAAIQSVLPKPIQELMKNYKGDEAPEDRLARVWPQYSTAIAETRKSEQEAKAGKASEPESAKAKSAFENDFDKLFKDEFGIILLRGNNFKGVRIYCYLKCSISQLKRLNEALKGKEEFVISDYGTVIAAGKGKPPGSLRKEIDLAYPGTVVTPGSIHRGNSALITGPWEKLLESAPGDLPDLLYRRATDFAEKGEVKEVIRSAAKLREVGIKNKSILYDAACAYSLGAQLLVKEKAKPTPGEIEESKKYLDLTLACLKEAIAAGYSDFDAMADDEDLGPVRNLPEFKALLPKPANERPKEAIPEFEETIRRDPKIAGPHNDLAWLLATCPDEKFRNPKRAVELAKKATELAPKIGTYWNTLGVAYYRASDWKATIEALQKSMELRKGGDANDWFFLAMARWQLGDKEDARKWFDQAAEWLEKNDPKDEELLRFRAEAERTLGAGDKK